MNSPHASSSFFAPIQDEALNKLCIAFYSENSDKTKGHDKRGIFVFNNQLRYF